MATVPTLLSKLAAYMNKTTGDLTVNGVNLGLDALNQAHQYAQMQRDFEYAKVPVTYSINLTTGGVVSPATSVGGSAGDTVVKKIIQPWTMTGSNRVRPLHFEVQGSYKEDLNRAWAARPWDYRFTDPPLAVSNSVSVPSLVQIGTKLILTPADASTWGSGTSVTLGADVVKFFPDYGATDVETVDFFLFFGDEFLFWYAAHYINKYFKEFVPREEGNLDNSHLKDERDAAWADLIAWDASLVAAQELTLD